MSHSPVQFATCNDEEVVIQLTGFRPPPILSSECIDFYCVCPPPPIHDVVHYDCNFAMTSVLCCGLLSS